MKEVKEQAAEGQAFPHCAAASRKGCETGGLTIGIITASSAELT
jgi:hypothetical protein